MTEEDLERADDRVFELIYPICTPSTGSPLRKETEGWRYAQRCSFASCPDPTRGWIEREPQGKSAKSRLAEATIVCRVCAHPWERWEAITHQSPASQRVNGFDGGARLARLRPGIDPYPEQQIYVNPDRPHSSSTETRILGSGSGIYVWMGVNRVARAFYRHRPWHWHSRVYFAYVLGIRGRHGLGGLREMAARAQERWPKAPHAWTYARVRELQVGGRQEWARRLSVEDLLWGEGKRRWNGSAKSVSRARHCASA